MQLRYLSTQKMRMGEFWKIAQDLTNRGFSEDRMKEQGVVHERMVVSSYSRAFSYFTLSVGASQDATDMLAAMRAGAGRDDMDVVLWSKCLASSDRTAAAFASLFPYKSHFVEAAAEGHKAIYHADLVPFPDAGMLISNCLKLESVLALLRQDGDFAMGIDAKAAHDILSEGIHSIPAESTMKDYVARYLHGLLGSLRQKFEFEFNRIKADPLIGQTLCSVADRE